MTPGSDISYVLAVGGFPGISVPAGYDNKGMPFGICFGGLNVGTMGWVLLKIFRKRFNNLDPNRTIKSTNLTIMT